MLNSREDLLRIYQQALNTVSGDRAVKQALADDKLDGDWYLIAIGKAASAMTQGALQVMDKRIVQGLVISKHQHLDADVLQDQRLQCLEADHPIPAKASFQAGEALLSFIAQLPQNAQCLCLISGGASSLVEVLEDGWNAEELQTLTHYLLANAYPIHTINAVRQRLSRIKSGGLWHFLQQRKVHALLISDVPNDDPAIIGSGLLFPNTAKVLADLPDPWQNRVTREKTPPSIPTDFSWRLCASSMIARKAAAQTAKKLGYRVYLQTEFLEHEAVIVAEKIVATLKDAPSGIYIWGAETTVRLPDNPGKGGRNQHLALAAAIALEGCEGILILAAGTDGTDGLSDDSGGLIDGQTLARGRLDGLDPKVELAKANANAFLRASGDLLHTGVTGTNVMDLIIALKC